MIISPWEIKKSRCKNRASFLRTDEMFYLERLSAAPTLPPLPRLPSFGNPPQAQRSDGRSPLSRTLVYATSLTRSFSSTMAVPGLCDEHR